LRAKQKISDDRKQQAVHHQLGQTVKEAEDDVKREPDAKQPARPIPAAKQKHSPKYSEKPDKAHPDHFDIERFPGELGCMICHPDDTRDREQASDDNDGKRSFAHEVMRRMCCCIFQRAERLLVAYHHLDNSNALSTKMKAQGNVTNKIIHFHRVLAVIKNVMAAAK